MTTLFVLCLMCFGALCSLVLIPLVLLKVVFTLVLTLVLIPLKIIGAVMGGLFRGVFKGMFWFTLLMIPLALIAFPVTILAFGAWLLFRALRPRRPRQAYVVS
ncbi:MAG: hypothetical protein JJE39_04890 [Vicinamibacteria bacterium]|nr:hypothetical protein [Vicinamibacteria bacterium]